MTRARSAVLTTAVAATIATLTAGCGSHSSQPTAASQPTVSARPSHSTASAPAVTPPLGAAAPTLSAQQVADNGLPSKVGPGKLSAATLKRLVQYFEDKVSKAYATGNADALDHYLAGPMLSGNRATVNLLTSEHKRNVFRIHVLSVKPQTNQAHTVILAMTGDMKVNYFFDPRTHKVLDNGLPGPSQVSFLIFLNQNPATGTWYWTGEKSNASTAPGSTGTVG